MKKTKNVKFIDSSLSDNDYLVKNYLSNLNESNDKTLMENEKVSEDVYFHGSSDDINYKLNHVINWLTKDYDYAKSYALATSDIGYVYECSAIFNNLFDIGKTDVRVFDLLPIKPYKLSREFTKVVRELNLSEEQVNKLLENVIEERQLDNDGYKMMISTVARSSAFKRVLESKGYDGVKAQERFNGKFVDTFGIFDSVRIINKEEVGIGELNEKEYPRPQKLYNIDNGEATWPEDAEDWIWWKSEADKWAEDYAKSYRVRMSPKDFLDLTTDKGADAYKVGDYVGGTQLRQLDVDELNKETYQNIFLKIAFRSELPTYAQVIGHEGRHRMFALWQAGVNSVDVELYCDVWDTNYEKYNPPKLDEITLQGQFNKSVYVTVYNPIPMSWKQHKAMRPNLTDEELDEMMSRGYVEDDKIIRYFNECVATLKPLYNKFYDEDIFSYDDIELKFGETAHTFGTMTLPGPSNDDFVLTLNKHLFEEPEDAIKNVIYHELCHYITDKIAIEKGVYYEKSPGRWYVDNRNWQSKLFKGHGIMWKRIASIVGSATGQDITRTNTFDLHTEVGKYAQEKYKYIVKCKHCGTEFKFMKLTNFVKAILNGDGHTDNWWCNCDDGYKGHDFEIVKGK